MAEAPKTLVREGEIVGAIGVSTGTVEQDQEVANLGLRVGHRLHRR